MARSRCPINNPSECDGQGPHPRFVHTSLPGDCTTKAKERVCCARGEAENRLRDTQLDLFGRRATAHRFAANQLCLPLTVFVYTLATQLRRRPLQGTELACVCAAMTYSGW